MAGSTGSKRYAAQVVRLLKRAYPDARCALEFDSPLDLLVATILAAQCTDERVNQVTRRLFRRYTSAADYAQARPSQLEDAIRSTGFYRNKAKSIRSVCRALAQEHGGQVPRDMETLVQLPGIGRKTANVVLGTAHGIASGIAVDTHVSRVSRRLGLTSEKTAESIEQDLMQRVPRKEWIDFSHRMIHHGRQVCRARKPQCDACPLEAICPRVGVDSS